MTKAQIHIFEKQTQQDQLTSFRQLTKKLYVTNENKKMTNTNQLLKTATEQNTEAEQLGKQLRQGKLDCRVAVAKTEVNESD